MVEIGDQLEDLVTDLDWKCPDCGKRDFNIYVEQKLGTAVKKRGEWDIEHCEGFYGEDIYHFECRKCGRNEEVA